MSAILLPSFVRLCSFSFSLPVLSLYFIWQGRSTLSITRKKSQFSFKWFELGSNLLSINRREQTASPIYSIMAGLKTSEEDHHLYPGTIIASFIRWTLGITISIEVNDHTTSIIHTTLHEARVHGQHTPKAPTFRLQPQPNLHEIQQPKLLVVPRGRHPPIINS